MNKSELQQLNLKELKQRAVSKGIKKKGQGWSTCCPPSGRKSDIIAALIKTPRKSSRKSSRKGPSESATIFPVGYRMKGNDGNRWEVMADKNGTKRWKRVSGQSKKKGRRVPLRQPSKRSSSPFWKNYTGTKGQQYYERKIEEMYRRYNIPRNARQKQSPKKYYGTKGQQYYQRKLDEIETKYKKKFSTVACSRRRKKSCIKSPSCKWIVGKGCKKSMKGAGRVFSKPIVYEEEEEEEEDFPEVFMDPYYSSTRIIDNYMTPDVRSELVTSPNFDRNYRRRVNSRRMRDSLRRLRSPPREIPEQRRMRSRRRRRRTRSFDESDL